MALPIDFVAALTTEPSVDFVSALSAEQGCDVCHELHASVYELRCACCEAAICPDCSRLRTDATMACIVCFHRDPGSAFKGNKSNKGGGRRRQTLTLVQHRASLLRDSMSELVRRVRAGEGLAANARLVLLTLANRLRELVAARERISYTRVLSTGLPARDALTRSARRAYAAVSTHYEAASARAHQGSAIVLAHSRRHAHATSRRASALALAMGMRGRQWGKLSALHGGRALRVSATFLRLHGAALAARTRRGSLAFAAGARRGWERSAHASRRGYAHTREITLQGVVAVRNVPVRHHATAMMLATLLLYAVARADHRDA
ncbi:MAG: hypothetical protein ABW352_01020 [Polyangiales bacterium]